MESVYRGKGGTVEGGRVNGEGGGGRERGEGGGERGEGR